MARRSGRVLRAHPKLLVFPLIGGLSGIAFIATLFGSLLLTDSVQDPGLVLYGALFVAYLVETFVASFFTAALVAATRTVFHGEEPSIRGSLAAAWQRKLPLLAWPSPAYREYLTFVATILATLAVLQYTGIFYETSSAIDLRHLISVGLILPVTTYLLTVIQENIEWIPPWDRMIQTDD